METAEFAVSQRIDHEPAFNWFVQHVLKKRDKVIASIRKQQARYLKRSHKLGIELPKNVKEAYALDAKNGNTLWADVISGNGECQNPFEVLQYGKSAPISHQFVQCHMVFDVKMEDFRRRVRLVSGHMTEAPATITYASIVSKETGRIALMIEFKSGDILNLYAQAPVTEMVWTILDPDFGKDATKTAVIVRA